MSYFAVELFTACAFAGLFYLEIGRNILDLPYLRDRQWRNPHRPDALAGLGRLLWHATLLGFLITTSFCDLAIS